MKKFLVLMKVSLRSMLAASAFRGRRRAVSGLGMLALLAFLGLYISGVYSSMLLTVLAPMGMEDMVFIYMGLVALIGGLMYTVMAVKGIVFGGKDNDLLLSMPVSSTVLMISRVLAVYVEDLVFSFFVLLPAGIACAVLSPSGMGSTPLFWVRLVLAAVLLPLMSTALSVLVGAVAAFVESKTARKTLSKNLFMGLVLVLVFWFSFSINRMLADLAVNAQQIREGLSWAAPFVWMADGLKGDGLRLLAFALCCVLPFLLVVFVLGKCYRRAVTAFSARSARSDYRLSRQTFSGQKKALLRKEWKRFVGTPAYLWNAGLGAILLPVLSVAALWRGELLRELIPGLPAAPMAGVLMGFCLSTCVITAPSVSLEGKCFWILREAPLAGELLLGVKAGFQLLITLPCTLVAAACLTPALGLPLWQGAALLAVMALYAVGHACFGLLMGLLFPRLDAPNETVVIKQSMASLLAMFPPMLMLAAAGLVCWLGSLLGPAAAALFPTVLMAAFALVSVLLLKRKGPAILNSL